MKKVIIGVVVGLVLVVVGAVILVGMNLNSIIKNAVETQGSKLAKVSITLDKVSLSLLSGKGEISGLVIGNPEGFKSPSAMRIGQASLHIEPRSVFSDKVIIRSIIVKAPEITLEGDLIKNNLSKLAANVDESAKSAPAAEPAAKGPSASKGPGKKLQLDEFLLTDAKVTIVQSVVGSSTNNAVLPKLEIKNLGQGPEGITGPELAKKLLGSVCVEAVKQGGTDAAKGALNQGVEKLKGLFKK
jgi:uncharacterized protein involved in outer membrane biogenesis